MDGCPNHFKSNSERKTLFRGPIMQISAAIPSRGKSVFVLASLTFIAGVSGMAISYLYLASSHQLDVSPERRASSPARSWPRPASSRSPFNGQSVVGEQELRRQPTAERHSYRRWPSTIGWPIFAATERIGLSRTGMLR